MEESAGGQDIVVPPKRDSRGKIQLSAYGHGRYPDTGESGDAYDTEALTASASRVDRLRK